MKINWLYDVSGIDWQELAELYRIAPLGDKEPLDLHRAFTNSMYKCFLIHEERIIGVGRALADGVDCSYICDLAVHPDFQGQGLGQEIVRKLTQLSAKHKKIILDGSHNIDGADKLNEFLKTERIKPIVLFGMLNNKKANLFLNKIKKRVSKVLAIEIPDEKNSFKTKQINEICNFHSIKCEQINNINDALKYFRSHQQKIYLITGSLYLIGKIRKKLL